MASSAAKQWHVANWGAWGWAETGLKLTACVFAFVALGLALGDPLDWAGPTRGGQVGILAALSVGLTLAIVDRVIDRELIALGFLLVNVAAHWAMTIATAISADVGGLLVAFAALMLAGDLVKLGMLATTDFTVRDLPRGLLFALTGIYVLGYVLILVLAAI